MKARFFTLFTLIIGLALLLAGNATAQGPTLSGHEPTAHGRAEHPSHPHGVNAESKASTHPASSSSAGDVNAAALGAPGTVYRYSTTFGNYWAPYLSTTNHLNHPYSLAVDEANNVYVGESGGHRVLKFNSSGTFQAQIGKTGVCDAWDGAGSGICNAYGVAVGTDGNVWIAESSDRVSVFTYTTTSFTYLDQVGVTWEYGYDDEHLDEPEGVAFDSAGRIYVADNWNDRVQIFDSSGAYSATLDGFSYPMGLAISSDDTLYVADTENYCVQVYRLEGDSMVYDDSICSYDGVDFQWVNAVAVAGDRLYVADETDDNGYIHVFDRSSGDYLSTIDGDCGGSDDWFCSPYDVAVDSSGEVYVADPWAHNQVMKCSSSGSVWTCSAFAGTKDVPYTSDNYKYYDPEGIAVDGAGNLLVTESDGDRLLKLNGAGAFQWKVGMAGVWGDDNAHFDGPGHVAVDSSGRVYVADSYNNRVQVFYSNGNYFTTLGGGDCDESDFCWPTGVAVGSDGSIYVADADNYQVQKCTLGSGGSSYTCSTVGDYDDFDYPVGVAVDSSNNVYVADEDQYVVKKCTPGSGTYSCAVFAGVPDEWGGDFDHLDSPHDVAVVGGKVFVADSSNDRIQVFDASGAYLTTIGGNEGYKTGQLNYPMAMDVDAAGNVYVADTDGNRIQKFASGVAGWKQVNINGFGDRWAEWASALETFNGQLYAASANWGSGARIWRTANGNVWTAMTQPGFGDVYTNTNPVIPDMLVFGGQLYASTGWDESAGQVWRSSNGSTWQPVTTDGFGDSGNYSVSNFAAFGNKLYAGTGNDNGAQIWRSDSGSSGSWVQVATDGLGSSDANQVTAFAVFTGGLYAAIETNQGGAVQIWNTANGTGWTAIVTDGFGDEDNYQTGGMAVFGGYLYVGTRNDTTGGQLWRTANGTTWTQVMGDGFGDSDNVKVESLFTFANDLYIIAYNETTGMEVWRSPDGTTWDQVNPDGFGDSNNKDSLWSSAAVTFNDDLYIGIWNIANGGEVWQMVNNNFVHLPIVVKNR